MLVLAIRTGIDRGHKYTCSETKLNKAVMLGRSRKCQETFSQTFTLPPPDMSFMPSFDPTI